MYEIRCGQLHVKIESAKSPRDAALQALRNMDYCKLNHIVEITANANTSMIPVFDLICVILEEEEPKLRIHEEDAK